MNHGPLPQAEFEAIYSRVPQLTVEVIVSSPDGVLLTRRSSGPCAGLWHIPGGTVRFGEPLTDAVRRVAADELGLEVVVDGFLGYVEYPSHLTRAADWPVGLAFKVHLLEPEAGSPEVGEDARWFSRLPDEMHDEQVSLLRTHGLAV